MTTFVPFPLDPAPRLAPVYLQAIVNAARRVCQAKRRKFARSYADRARELLAEELAQFRGG